MAWHASISITTGNHISRACVKVNDTYFNQTTYNIPAYRRQVMCQDVGHTFGLAHQDENQTNPNLGSCMEYTRDPDGPPSNEHPNAHDYAQPSNQAERSASSGHGGRRTGRKTLPP